MDSFTSTQNYLYREHAKLSAHRHQNSHLSKVSVFLTKYSLIQCLLDHSGLTDQIL